MGWNKLFPSDNQPSFTDMENYIGGEGQRLWTELFEYMLKSYKAKPKMFYSGCSSKPGWNVKFQKGGQSFGTLYPEENGFSVFMVISYKLDSVMDILKNELSAKMQKLYNTAQDYMKMGKWMMFRIENDRDLEDYKLLISAKAEPLKGGK